MSTATFLPRPPDRLAEVGPLVVAVLIVFAAKPLGYGGSVWVDSLIVLAYGLGVWSERRRAEAYR